MEIFQVYIYLFGFMYKYTYLSGYKYEIESFGRLLSTYTHKISRFEYRKNKIRVPNRSSQSFVDRNYIN